MLAGWPGELVERERLAAGMWGDDAPATVANTLQAHVSQLRRIVGKHTVQCEGTSYRLDIDPTAVDAEQFTEKVHEAARMRRRRHFARSVELLSSAVELWRGVPFPDVHDLDLQARRARLEELREQAMEDLLESRLELCTDAFDLADIIADAKEMISRHPLREKAHVVLVRALSAADRPGEAGAAFEEAARNLRSNMGLDPGRAMVEAHTRGLNHQPEILPQAMRTISVLPDYPEPTSELRRDAARVRTTVTDYSPVCTTVVESDPDRAAQLSVAIGEELRADAPYAILVCPGEDISSAVITEHIGGATDTARIDVTNFPDMSGVILVIDGTGQSVRKLLNSMRRWASRPLVIAVGPEPVGVDGEVIIEGPARSTPQDRGGGISAGSGSGTYIRIGA
jgi:DNA-binding SARP family transcriptional activator